jgi:hypothetical protein
LIGYGPAERVRRDVVLKTKGVQKLSAGVIKPAGSSGRQFVKLTDESPTCLLLEVRGSFAVQELRVYSQAMRDTKLSLARKLRDNGISIKFR